MFFDHHGGRAVDKRFVFQLPFHRSQFGFNLRNFFVESLALRRFVPAANDKENLAERRDRDRDASRSFILSIQLNLLCIQQSRDRR